MKFNRKKRGSLAEALIGVLCLIYGAAVLNLGWRLAAVMGQHWAEPSHSVLSFLGRGTLLTLFETAVILAAMVASVLPGMLAFTRYSTPEGDRENVNVLCFIASCAIVFGNMGILIVGYNKHTEFIP